MPYLHDRNYDDFHNRIYGRDKKIPERERIFFAGYDIVRNHPLFGNLDGDIYLKTRQVMAGGGACVVESNGKIYVNTFAGYDSSEWAYLIAHCLLHLAFGHFDKDKMPAADVEGLDIPAWNMACDIYIARFLADIRFGSPIVPDPAGRFKIRLNDEVKIYSYLKMSGTLPEPGSYGTNKKGSSDMIGLNRPLTYKAGQLNPFAKAFSSALNNSVNNAVSHAGGHDWDSEKETSVRKASEWFLSHYPLLGGLAASFRLVEDPELCQKYEIHIAAVDAALGEIYCNPASGLSTEEWRFVLAHEYLHAGLMHHKRGLGRDRYLWNVACDYCVNGWLVDMKIGRMPDEVLYDQTLKNLSAETIYDLLIKEMRKYRKLATFRGYAKGDIMSGPFPTFGGLNNGRNDGNEGTGTGDYSGGISMDEFLKNALWEGLDFHTTNSRGYLPAGLVEEIRALTSPPIPWEVDLGHWFDHMFPPLEKHRSYARPSRRQSASPDIPRPRYTFTEVDLADRTFGVVVDTSGSVSATQLGLSLGAIASYAAAKEVRYIRIVFCDAGAYDQGYLTPDDLAGRVRVTGRGGTVLQPAINLLEKMQDFPEDAPILIITDGFIEDRLRISRDHAYLLPKGNRLPFRAKGEIFYFKEREVL